MITYLTYHHQVTRLFHAAYNNYISSTALQAKTSSFVFHRFLSWTNRAETCPNNFAIFFFMPYSLSVAPENSALGHSGVYILPQDLFLITKLLNSFLLLNWKVALLIFNYKKYIPCKISSLNSRTSNEIGKQSIHLQTRKSSSRSLRNPITT